MINSIGNLFTVGQTIRDQLSSNQNKTAQSHPAETPSNDVSKSINVLLPNEILLHIFSFFEVKTLKSVPLVCKSWNIISSDSTLWKPFFEKHSPAWVMPYSSFFPSSQTTSSTPNTTTTTSSSEESYKKKYKEFQLTVRKVAKLEKRDLDGGFIKSNDIFKKLAPGQFYSFVSLSCEIPCFYIIANFNGDKVSEKTFTYQDWEKEKREFTNQGYTEKLNLS